MKDILAIVGLLIILQFLAGAVGIGDFYLYWGTNAKQWCQDTVKERTS